MSSKGERKSTNKPASKPHMSFSQQAGSSNMPIMWPMSPMFNPYQLYAPPANAPAAAAAPCKRPSEDGKPWELSSSTSEEDEDFIPKKKRKPASKPTDASSSSAQFLKRGPGRPRKAEKAAPAPTPAQKLLKEYPPAFSLQDSVAYIEADECRSCKIYVGKVAIIPCGHYKYCFSCTNKLRTEALKMGRAAKCPAEKCYDLVESWLQLFNVSA